MCAHFSVDKLIHSILNLRSDRLNSILPSDVFYLPGINNEQVNSLNRTAIDNTFRNNYEPYSPCETAHW